MRDKYLDGYIDSSCEAQLLRQELEDAKALIRSHEQALDCRVEELGESMSAFGVPSIEFGDPTSRMSEADFRRLRTTFIVPVRVHIPVSYELAKGDKVEALGGYLLRELAEHVEGFLRNGWGEFEKAARAHFNGEPGPSVGSK